MRPRRLRLLARMLVHYAVSRRVRARSYWRAFLERHLAQIGGDIEAVVWAAGCAWSMRVERLIAKAPPVVNCALFLVGLNLEVKFLFAHLGWYGFPRGPLDFGVSAEREFAKFAISLCAIIIVGLAAPGSAHRRVFVACTFPFLGVLAMSMTGVGIQFASDIHLPEFPIAEAVLRGVALGVSIAAPLALPAALLYRSVAVPVAILSVLPAIAKADANLPQLRFASYADVLFWRLGPFMCALVVVMASTWACNRWQSRSLRPGRGR